MEAATLPKTPSLMDVRVQGSSLYRSFPEPPDYTPQEVRDVRRDMRLSQGAFGSLLGVSAAAIQSWEQGKSPPSAMGRRFLQLIRSGLDLPAIALEGKR